MLFIESDNNVLYFFIHRQIVALDASVMRF